MKLLSPFTLRTQAEDAVFDLPSLRSAAEKLAANVVQGTHAQKKSGGHEKFWQFRDYQESDRPQDIDWRQSAKTDHVYVREKELQTPQSAYVWCQRGAGMDFKSGDALHSKSEAAQVLSLAGAILLQRGDEQVGFLGAEQSGRSEATLERIGRKAFEPSDETFPEASAAKNSTLLFFGDFLQSIDEIEAGFLPYGGRHMGSMVVQVLDPAEIELPYSGHVVFEGTRDIRNKVDNVSGVRAAYQERIQAHLHSVKDFCSVQGWHYILHRTDMPIETTMLGIWEALGA